MHGLSIAPEPDVCSCPASLARCLERLLDCCRPADNADIGPVLEKRSEWAWQRLLRFRHS
jgi:hypothetical protein